MTTLIKSRSKACLAPTKFMGIIIFTGLFFYSCTENKDDGKKEEFIPKLSVSIASKSVQMEGASGIQTIRVSANSEWSVSLDNRAEGWLTVQKATTSFTLTTQANETGNSRTATGTVALTTYKDYVYSFDIMQSSLTSELIITPISISASKDGGDFRFTVKHTAVIWEYSISNDAGEWISEKEKTDDTLTLTIRKNEGERRSADIIFKDSHEKVQNSIVHVIQDNGVVQDNSPLGRDYALRTSLQGSEDLLNKDYKAINAYMKNYGFDYTENPYSTEKGPYTHPDAIHCENIYDETLKQYVFQLFSHVENHLDSERGELKDRQRNEMKSISGSDYNHVNGNWDEWQVLEWKLKLPKGFS